MERQLGVVIQIERLVVVQLSEGLRGGAMLDQPRGRRSADDPPVSAQVVAVGVRNKTHVAGRATVQEQFSALDQKFVLPIEHGERSATSRRRRGLREVLLPQVA